MGAGGAQAAQAEGAAQAYRMISDGKFGKSEHLTKTKDFREVYKGGYVGRRGGCLLYALPERGGKSRIGFSIGARVVRSAVKRNRLRRLFREAYRLNKEACAAGWKMVLVVKRAPVHMCRQEAEALFLSLLREVIRKNK